MYKRIIAVDPSLLNQFSHNYRYINSLKEKFPQSEVVVYCAKTFSGTFDEVALHKRFDVNMYDEYAYVHDAPFIADTKEYDPRVKLIASTLSSMGLKGDFFAKILVSTVRLVRGVIGAIRRLTMFNRAEYETPNKLALQLFSALNDAQLTEHDLVVFPTALGNLLESLMTVRCFKGNQCWPARASFIMHFDYKIFSNGYASFSRRLYRQRVIENLPFKEVQICVTNEPLAQRMSNDLSFTPVVIQDLVAEHPRGASEPANTHQGTRILIPGKYMWDKNFQDVPLLLNALRDTDCEVTLHSSVLQHISVDEALLSKLHVYEDVHGDEQWFEFLASFDCLLLPYGEHYRYRISGMLSEGKFLGVPTIASAVVADASRLNTSCVYEHPSDLRSIIQNIGSQKITGVNGYKNTDFPHYSEAITDAQRFIETKTKPICIQIKPAWTRCGSSLVFENQIEYLLNRNYFVVELLVRNENWNRTRDQVVESYDILMDNRLDFGGSVAYVVRPNPSLLNMLEWVTQIRQLVRYGPIARYHHLMDSMGIPSTLNQLTKNAQVDLVVANHVFHLGLARRFNAKNVVCETHDIQSRQYQIRGLLGDEFGYNRSIDEELNILQKSADLLINISAYENYFYTKRVKKPSLLCKPYRVLDSGGVDEFDCLADLLKANVKAEFLPDLGAIPAPDQYFDLFFVGDAHHANISSIEWFIAEVLPLLPGRKLCLAGTISTHFAKTLGEHEQLIYLGYVLSLANIYQFVKVAILPDIEGAGIPIKTIEVLANGVAFVATTKSMRGLDASAYQFEPKDVADELADDIELLLSSSRRREERIELGSQMSKAFTRERYFEVWDQAISVLSDG